MHYSIPDFRNTEEFLTLLAQKRGMLKKGGVPDVENIAKLLLCDWTGYVCYEFCFMLLTFFHVVNPAQQKLPSPEKYLERRGCFFCCFFLLSHILLW